MTMPHYTAEELFAHEAAVEAANDADESVRDMPTTASIAEIIQTLISPECDDDMRAELVESLTDHGRVSSRTFREAGILTSNDGIVLRIGRIEFQITIV
jgi:hypothetical protein